VLPARDSSEVALAGVGSDRVSETELKYSLAALEAVVKTLRVVVSVVRVDVTM
jgi:hypothetical protein